MGSSLFSGGEDGNGIMEVSIHDHTFKPSNIFKQRGSEATISMAQSTSWQESSNPHNKTTWELN